MTSSHLYDKEFLMKTFGTANPSISERTNVFNEMWDSWKDNNLMLKHYTQAKKVRQLLKDLGLTEFSDFQISSRQLRFRDHDDLSFALLSGLGEYCV